MFSLNTSGAVEDYADHHLRVIRNAAASIVIVWYLKQIEVEFLDHSVDEEGQVALGEASRRCRGEAGSSACCPICGRVGKVWPWAFNPTYLDGFLLIYI
jgi:hypothetical protein